VLESSNPAILSFWVVLEQEMATVVAAGLLLAMFSFFFSLSIS
jgi:hypothetical protein